MKKSRVNKILSSLAVLTLFTLALSGKSEPGETTKTFPVKSLFTNYFVDQSDINANDNNAGTESKPFKSIEGCFKAIAKILKPGDNVWIKNGEYRCVSLRLGEGGISIPSGASYSKMISIMAFPGHKPLINQSSLVDNWKIFKDKIWVADYQDSKRVFPVTFSDGEPLSQIGGTTRYFPQFWRGKKGETIDDMEAGSFFFDEKEKKLYVWLKDGDDPNQHKMEAYGNEGKKDVNEFVVKGLQFIKISGLNIKYGGITLVGANSIIEDIDQSWGSVGGCFVGGEFNTVLNCKFNHNGNNGMGGTGRGHRILDCETNYNNFRNWGNGWHSGGVKFVSTCHDWVVKGHVASYNNGDGIWFDAFMSNVTIEGCRSFRNKASGIHYEIGTRGVIKNNICYENGMRGIYLSSSSYCLVINNLCYKNAMSGIVSIGTKRSDIRNFCRGTGIIPGGHNVIMGNIMVDNCDAKGLLGLYQKWPISPLYKVLFAARFEKIKDWDKRPELILPDPNGEPANAGCYSDYNIFYRSGERGKKPQHLAFGYNWDVGYAHGLVDWSKKTGFDKNSIFAEPKFKDLANYDFHPAKECPSQWFMEKYDPGLKCDYDGIKRPNKPKAHTAGPYSGDIDLYKKMTQKTDAGAYDIFSIHLRKPVWRPGRVAWANFCKTLKIQEIAKFKTGIKLDGIPFIAPGGAQNQLYFSKLNSQKFSIKPEKQLKELYFLFSADAMEKPSVRCTIHRGDGVKIVFDWKSDGKGGFETIPLKNFSTKRIWKGNCVIHSEKGGKNEVERSIFMTTWKNDNEWLPVTQIDFEHIDKSANFALLGISGKNLK